MDFITDYEMIIMSAVVGVIVGLSQILKKFGINPKFIPIFDLIFGIIACVFLLNTEPVLRVFNGLIVGLSASGLYSGTKNVKQGVRHE